MKVISSIVAAGLITGAFILSSYGDPSPQVAGAFPPTLPEPTTYPPTTPNPGSEKPPRDPFTPYATGSLAPWEYEDLKPAEQAIVDRGIDTSKHEPVHAAFDAATRQQAMAVSTQAAAISLGVPDLQAIGVVP